MKSIEILLRFFDYILTTLLQKKTQNERDKLEELPADWFSEHFSNSVSSKRTTKADQANPTNRTEG